jgi:cytochrome c biogenesis protein CcmG/thiol:disulfide interchange protein DsbE
VTGGSLLAVLLLLLLLLLGSAACGASTPPFYARISGTLPALSGPTLDGGALRPATYRGRIVVLNFWNQDCPPCRREMPLLQQESTGLAASGVAVIGVLYVGQGWPDDPAAARSFVRQQGVGYPVLTDAGSAWARATSIQGLPSTVVADRAGHLRFRVLGELKPGQLGQLVSMIDAGS